MTTPFDTPNLPEDERTAIIQRLRKSCAILDQIKLTGVSRVKSGKDVTYYFHTELSEEPLEIELETMYAMTDGRLKMRWAKWCMANVNLIPMGGTVGTNDVQALMDSARVTDIRDDKQLPTVEEWIARWVGSAWHDLATLDEWVRKLCASDDEEKYTGPLTKGCYYFSMKGKTTGRIFGYVDDGYFRFKADDFRDFLDEHRGREVIKTFPDILENNGWRYKGKDGASFKGNVVSVRNLWTSPRNWLPE